MNLPIPCVPSMYLTEFANGTTTLYEYNVVTGNRVTLATYNIGLNAVGYSNLDRCLYAIELGTNELSKIDFDGSAYVLSNLGAVTNLPLPLTNSKAYDSASCDQNGYMYVSMASSSNDVNAGILYVIDVNSSRSTYKGLVDPVNGFVAATTSNYRIAPYNNYKKQGIDNFFDPINGLLCFVTSDGLNLVCCDPTIPVSDDNPQYFPITNLPISTTNTGFGAQMCDREGRICVLYNASGDLYYLKKESDNSYRGIMLNNKLISSTSNDGAFCTDALVEIDFGDAPDLGSGNDLGNYKTLLSRNGPRHQIIRDHPLYLGVTATSEFGAYHNWNATADDLIEGIQDDGLSSPIPPVIAYASTYYLDISVTNESDADALLYAWIDLNQDGIFSVNEMMQEGPVTVASASTNPRTFRVSWPLPMEDFERAHTFIRIRLTSDPYFTSQSVPVNGEEEDPRSLGAAANGEVEDYYVDINQFDFGDAPDTSPGTSANNYNTLLESNGPRHIVRARRKLFLGTRITVEHNANQNETATGDDLLEGIIDDGIMTPLYPLVEGKGTYQVTAYATNMTGDKAYLYAWLDGNQNGVFEYGEMIHNGPLLIPSTTSGLPQKVRLTWTVPMEFIENHTYIRVRLTSDEALYQSPVGNEDAEDTRSLGEAIDGEVEDYYLEIVPDSPRGILFI